MASDRSRAFSLLRLSFIAIGIFALSSLIAIAALTGVQSSSQQAVASWREFSDQASAEQRSLRAFVTQAGVAGFIEDYHKLAATGDQALVPMIYGRGGGALAALATYPVSDPEGPAGQARTKLQALIRTYMARVAPILAMHGANRPVSAILAASDIPADGASAALDALTAATPFSTVADATAADSKALVLLDVRRLLGFEGLVHNANRFLTNPDVQSLDRVGQDLVRTERALDQYSRLVTTAEESKALKALRAEVDSAEARLMSTQSDGALVFDASGLQTTLMNLELMLYAEAMTAQANLQATLEEVSERTGGMMILVIAGALALIAGAAWLLIFRIGRRIKAITRTMRELASGKLDAEVPACSDHDEIGEMSRALLVFRDGLRANAALTTELAESSRLASLGAMVAGMAHELNTPLGNALAVASTLEEQCKTFRKDLGSGRLLRSALDGHATGMEDASNLIQRNLVRAAEQIGSFKQVAVDQTSGKRREFQLDDVISNVVQSMSPTFKRTPYTLTTGRPSDVTMDSYPGALSQVLTNLIENGLKHGLTGQATGKVEVLVRSLGPDFTEIEISDDGAGVPDAIRPSIFNAFFTTAAGKGGSGLGLHIVKSIVCGPLGGQISVLPGSANRGSRFVIQLPNHAPVQGTADTVTERKYYAAAQHAA
jgi:signal transduction histidine kinase